MSTLELPMTTGSEPLNGRLQAIYAKARRFALGIEVRPSDFGFLLLLLITAFAYHGPSRYWSGQGYINHPDHRIAGEAALGAIIPVAGTRLAFPELIAEGLAPHEVKEVYITMGDDADRWVDIGGFLDQKMAALRAHKSQMRDWDPGEMVADWAKQTAAQARRHGHEMEYAEGYKYIKRGD